MTRKPLCPMVVCATLAFVLAVGLFVTNSHSIFARSIAATGGPTKLHVIEHDTNDTTVDIGPKGDSPGDLAVFSSPVYNAANTKQIGHDSGTCVRTVVGKAYECSFTVFLPKGQISLEGPFYDNADSMLSITGGTGHYSNVRGEMKLHDRGHSEYDYIFYLS